MVKYQCDKCKKVMNREEAKEYFNSKTIFIYVVHAKYY